MNLEFLVLTNLPGTEGKTLNYGHKEIQSLADRFVLKPIQVSTEWVDLLIKMIQEEGYCRSKTKKTGAFGFLVKAQKYKLGTMN